MKKVFLTEICEIQIGRTPSRAISSYWGEGESWVSIADLNNRTFINSTKECITHEAVQKCNCKKIPVNTVLFSFKLSIGKVAITQKPLFTNEAIVALLPLTKKDFSTKYLYYGNYSSKIF
ncbi:MAG: restriction endonuclease subunit S [Candidatus Scalindua rubra]|uniref:Type I restriction modification DNA specificity domain protein n=1 Tax=Candidatus Scalindua brodae TaxID=237368 RepID=A0A0B0ELB4_9BACT|nr:MAG: Type I restriction modification DNA specificity domain protein [Candidatus Scalindua brodae]MBZ0109033.1 restriction endonuclease subunit S [Candidatus Scalindua rubra]